MSTTAKAILFYGFMLGEEFESPWNNDYLGWSDWFLQKQGLVYPTQLEEKRVYWEKTKLLEKEAGCDFGYCGCGNSYTESYVYITESEIFSDWCDSQEVKSLEIKSEWEAKLKAFCEQLGIEYQQPTWRLIVYYG